MGGPEIFKQGLQRGHMGSEFEHSNQWTSIQVAHNNFLRAIQKIKPQVLADLAGEPLSSWERGRRPSHWFDLYPYISVSDSCFEEETELLIWAERHNLRIGWLLAYARETLRWWAENRNSDCVGREWWNVPVFLPHLIPTDLHTLDIRLYLPNPGIESYERRRVERALREQAQLEIAKKLDLYDKFINGVRKSPTHFGLRRVYRKKEIHYDWLAWRVVHGLTAHEIAAKYDTEVDAGDASTITKATARLAKFLDIDLRRTGHGRRKK